MVIIISWYNGRMHRMPPMHIQRDKFESFTVAALTKFSWIYNIIIIGVQKKPGRVGIISMRPYKNVQFISYIILHAYIINCEFYAICELYIYIKLRRLLKISSCQYNSNHTIIEPSAVKSFVIEMCFSPNMFLPLHNRIFL